jgi:hypothetical protein
MSTTIVRYRVTPGHTEENAALVRAVYAELAATRPPGFHYATYLQDDGVSFVHIATTDDGHATPLPQLPAFQRFRAGLAERCDVAPEATTLTDRIGAYEPREPT